MKYDDFLKLQENVEHGTYLFPFKLYDTNVPYYYKSINIHWHEEMEIIIAKEGRGTYTIDFKEYEVKKGDIVVLMPSMLHSFKQIDNEIFMADTMVFNLNIINNSAIDVCAAKYFNPIIHRKISIPVIIHKEDNGYNYAHKYINSIINNFRQRKTCYELKIKSDFLLLFSTFYEYFIREDSYIEDKNNYMLEKIKCILSYVKDNYSEEITIDELSKISNMSKFYLMRSFKKYIGMTCTNYINSYRLNKASSKLISEDETIMNISIECGFNNISYFNKLFKEKFKITPKDYRSKYNTLKK